MCIWVLCLFACVCVRPAVGVVLVFVFIVAFFCIPSVIVLNIHSFVGRIIRRSRRRRRGRLVVFVLSSTNSYSARRFAAFRSDTTFGGSFGGSLIFLDLLLFVVSADGCELQSKRKSEHFLQKEKNPPKKKKTSSRKYFQKRKKKLKISTEMKWNTKTFAKSKSEKREKKKKKNTSEIFAILLSVLLFKKFQFYFCCCSLQSQCVPCLKLIRIYLYSIRRAARGVTYGQNI